MSTKIDGIVAKLSPGPKVGADALSSILQTVDQLDPSASDVVAIIGGLLALVPTAVADVQTLIAQIQGAPVTPIEPGIVQADAAILAELNTPVTPKS
jgi:hypothetical protein